MAVTRALMDCQEEDDIRAGIVTQRSSLALSNAFLASQVHELLPQAREQIDGFDSLSEWEIATILEATVVAAHGFSPDAVDDLARYLVRISTPKSLYEANPKGCVLNIGGTVRSSREGGTDHHPVFLSEACLCNTRASAHGVSKKEAERMACTKLLQLLELGITGEHNYSPHLIVPDNEEDMTNNESERNDATANATPVSVPANPTIPTTTDAAAERTYADDDNNIVLPHHGYVKRKLITIPITHDQWVPLNQPMGLARREDESFHAWWLRGAFVPRSAFQRAMASPLIFEDLLTVDSWTRRQVGENSTEIASVMMVITSTNNSVAMPIQSAGSATKARKDIGLLANEYISGNFQPMD